MIYNLNWVVIYLVLHILIQYTHHTQLYILLLLLSDLGNARVIIEAMLLIKTITPK